MVELNIIKIGKKNDISYGASNNKRLVNLLYGYNESRINSAKFDNKFTQMVQRKYNNTNYKTKPQWLEQIINAYDNLEKGGKLSFGSITEGEFRYKVMEVLNNLRKNGQYSKIIKNNYDKYVG